MLRHIRVRMTVDGYNKFGYVMIFLRRIVLVVHYLLTTLHWLLCCTYWGGFVFG